MKYMRGAAVSPDDVTDDDSRMALIGTRRAASLRWQWWSIEQSPTVPVDGICKCATVIYRVAMYAL
jgi:hypothetical protein